jgi:hypothetical protein
MGEYIILGKLGHFKLGTCEDLYYIRYHDLKASVERGETHPVSGNLPPKVYLQGDFRFRFPFPDEDQNQPGYTDKTPDRGFMVPWPSGLMPDVDHSTVPVRAHAIEEPNYFYAIGSRLPCPMDINNNSIWDGGIPIRRYLQVVQQKPVDGSLWTVVRCPYCGEKWRLSPDEGERLAEAIESYSQDHDYTELAARIRAGYQEAI